jgi:hypothetical protein
MGPSEREKKAKVVAESREDEADEYETEQEPLDPEPAALDNTPVPAPVPSPMPTATTTAQAAQGAGGATSGEESPSNSELEGPLTSLYEVWLSETYDPVGTDRADDQLSEVFKNTDIKPLSQNINCRATLCRIELSFSDANEMNKLHSINPASVPEHMAGKPEPSPDGKQNIVVYWKKDGAPPGSAAHDY